MNTLLETIAKNIVDNSDDVRVEMEDKEDGKILLTLYVNQDDMGKVIGKQGRVAKAIRTVVKSCAINQHKKVEVDIKHN